MSHLHVAVLGGLMPGSHAGLDRPILNESLAGSGRLWAADPRAGGKSLTRIPDAQTLLGARGGAACGAQRTGEGRTAGPSPLHHPDGHAARETAVSCTRTGRRRPDVQMARIRHPLFRWEKPPRGLHSQCAGVGAAARAGLWEVRVGTPSPPHGSVAGQDTAGFGRAAAAYCMDTWSLLGCGEGGGEGQDGMEHIW